MKKLLFVFFIFVMFSCEKSMIDVQTFEQGDDQNFRLKDSTIVDNPGHKGEDDDNLIIDP